MDTTALISKATQGPNIMEIWKEHPQLLESRSKRNTEAEQRVLGGENIVTGLEERFTKAERKMADGMDDMKNWSRRDNVLFLSLREGMEGKPSSNQRCCTDYEPQQHVMFKTWRGAENRLIWTWPQLTE